MSGRDQTLNARERALKAVELRYRNLTFREIGKQLFGVSRVRAFQLVSVGMKIEEKQASIAAKRIRREKNHDRAIEISRLLCKHVSAVSISEQLGIPVTEVEQVAEEGRQIVSRRAAYGVF